MIFELMEPEAEVSDNKETKRVFGKK